jgi:hypothetical protein
MYCNVQNNAGPVVIAWRTFRFISPIITYMRGGSQVYVFVTSQSYIVSHLILMEMCHSNC